VPELILPNLMPADRSFQTTKGKRNKHYSVGILNHLLQDKLSEPQGGKPPIHLYPWWIKRKDKSQN
jgi:hypothetical protein|tara:strand:+ start:284 stop:481 length:198 start_codon:yes stop_codon:yes gene_type:complete